MAGILYIAIVHEIAYFHDVLLRLFFFCVL